MQARITGDPEAPTNFNSDISHQLEEIILHAMEREPRNRYASAKEFAQELRNPDQVILSGRVERLKAPHIGRIHWRAVRFWLFLALIPAVIVLLAILLSRHK
jgi:serine/threonine protein kinase